MIPDDQQIIIAIGIILLYIPVVCYLDWKYREVGLVVWLPLIAINGLISYNLFSSGSYPIIAAAMGLLACFIWIFLFIDEIIQGADMIFLCIISMTYIVNPYPLPHGIMLFPFVIYLILSSAVIAIFLFSKWVHDGMNYKDALIKLRDYKEEVPFMFPISAAIILSVVLG